MFTSRWSIAEISGRVGVVRLDRWTGRLTWCAPTAAVAPNYLDCEPGEWEHVKP